MVNSMANVMVGLMVYG